MIRDSDFQNFYRDPQPEKKTIQRIKFFEKVDDPLLGWTRDKIIDWTKERMELQRLTSQALAKAKQEAEDDYFALIAIQSND